MTLRYFLRNAAELAQEVENTCVVGTGFTDHFKTSLEAVSVYIADERQLQNYRSSLSLLRKQGNMKIADFEALVRETSRRRNASRLGFAIKRKEFAEIYGV